MLETVLNMALTVIMTRPKNQFLNDVSRISCYKSFLKFFANTPAAESNVTEVVVQRPATLLKKRLWHRCFPVNFAKFLRAPILTKHLKWLFIKVGVSPSKEIIFYTLFFTSNTFISNARLKVAKNPTKAKQHLEAELLLFENYSHSSSKLPSKISKITSVSVFIRL